MVDFFRFSFDSRKSFDVRSTRSTGHKSGNLAVKGMAKANDRMLSSMLFVSANSVERGNYEDF